MLAQPRQLPVQTQEGLGSWLITHQVSYDTRISYEANRELGRNMYRSDEAQVASVTSSSALL